MTENVPGDYSGYLWRGGEKIVVEKEEAKFTVIPADHEVFRKASRIPGVRRVKQLTPAVYKVETTNEERDIVMNVLRTEPYHLTVHHAYRPVGERGTVYYLTDKLTIRLAPEAKTDAIEALEEKYQLKILKQYERLPRTYLLQVTGGRGENPLKTANRLMEEKNVTFAEPSLVNRFWPSFIPTDPYFKRQWHLNAEDGKDVLAGASVHAPDAWDITLGDRRIVVAMIDDGFDLDHPDLQGEGKIVHPKDYVDGDTSPFPEAEEGDYHGTCCAGVAIAEQNGKGVIGIAPGCAFMPVRFPLSAPDDLLLDIFGETGKWADVISCSWGPPPVYAPLPTAISDLFAELTVKGGPRGKGVVICFAAANFDAPIQSSGFPDGFVWLDYGTGETKRTYGRILNGFAAHPDVIAVAASTSLNKHAAYSNWGPEIAVAAPSNNFHPLEPDRKLAGLGIWTTDNEEHGSGFTKESTFTGEFGGTSSATPLTAGVAALVLTADPELSAREVKEILQLTADKIEDSDPDLVLKTNRGRYDDTGRCDWFGFGKVNAARAVKETRLREKK